MGLEKYICKCQLFVCAVHCRIQPLYTEFEKAQREGRTYFRLLMSKLWKVRHQIFYYTLFIDLRTEIIYFFKGPHMLHWEYVKRFPCYAWIKETVHINHTIVRKKSPWKNNTASVHFFTVIWNEQAAMWCLSVHLQKWMWLIQPIGLQMRVLREDHLYFSSTFISIILCTADYVLRIMEWYRLRSTVTCKFCGDTYGSRPTKSRWTTRGRRFREVAISKRLWMRIS